MAGVSLARMSMIYSGPPPVGTPVPNAVRKAAAGAAIHPVWQNELGGLTFRLGGGAGGWLGKWMPAGAGGVGGAGGGAGQGSELGAEAVRLRWASAYVTVPSVLEEGADDAGSWLVTAGIPGEYAVADRWKRDP